MDKIKKIIANIKTNGILRKLDELGRIVIPIEQRINKVIDGQTKVSVYQICNYVVIEILKDQSANIKKKFDNLGRVVVNAEIRSKLNWKNEDYIEIWNIGKYFILKKSEDSCVFCNEEKGLINYKGKLICKKCKKDLSNI